MEGGKGRQECSNYSIKRRKRKKEGKTHILRTEGKRGGGKRREKEVFFYPILGLGNFDNIQLVVAMVWM